MIIRPKSSFILAGTWKDRFTCSEAVQFTKHLIVDLENGQNPFEMVICPPMIALASVARIIPHKLSLGAQNLIWDDRYSFTGETRARALLEIGCKYVIIGHSERRLYLGETNSMVTRKVASSVNNGLIPIICIGEYLKEYLQGRAEQSIKKQLISVISVLRGIRKPSELVFAYEPAWAISTSKTTDKTSKGIKCDPDEANRRHQFIREIIRNKWGTEFAKEITIIYGGSINPKNAEKYFYQSDIDGGLVGAASQSKESFLKLINISRKIFSEKGTFGM